MEGGRTGPQGRSRPGTPMRTAIPLCALCVVLVGTGTALAQPAPPRPDAPPPPRPPAPARPAAPSGALTAAPTTTGVLPPGLPFGTGPTALPPSVAPEMLGDQQPFQFTVPQLTTPQLGPQLTPQPALQPAPVLPLPVLLARVRGF